MSPFPLATGRRPRHRRFAGALVALLFGPLASVHADASLAVQPGDLDRAGQLRMLAQRIAKLTLQQRLNVLPARALRERRDSVQQFDTHLAALSHLTALPRFTRPLERVTHRWQDYRRQLDQADPDTLHVVSEDLEIAVSQVSTLLEDETGTQGGRLQDLAERQTMLSQRMAKLFLLTRLGRHRQEDLEITRREFVNAMHALDSAQPSTARIQAQLVLARGQWFFYDQAMQADSVRDARYLENVATTSDRITEVMRDVIADFGKLR